MCFPKDSAKEKARRGHEDGRNDACLVRRGGRQVPGKEGGMGHWQRRLRDAWMTMRHHAAAQIGRAGGIRVVVTMVMRGAMCIGRSQVMLAGKRG